MQPRIDEIHEHAAKVRAYVREYLAPHHKKIRAEIQTRMEDLAAEKKEQEPKLRERLELEMTKLEAQMEPLQEQLRELESNLREKETVLRDAEKELRESFRNQQWRDGC